jgi:hypothetical protein
LAELGTFRKKSYVVAPGVVGGAPSVAGVSTVASITAFSSIPSVAGEHAVLFFLHAQK